MQTLRMIFGNAGGKKISLNLPEPKDGLTKTQVEAVMQTVIAKNVFDSTGGNLVKAIDSQIISHDVTGLA